MDEHVLDENSSVDKSLFEIYEEGIVNRAVNRVAGAVSNVGARVKNKVNAVKNVGNTASNIVKTAMNVGAGRSASQGLKQNISKINPQHAKTLKQIERLATNFVNDAVKLKLLSSGSSNDLSVVIEAAMASLLQVPVDSNLQQTVQNSVTNIIGAIRSLQYSSQTTPSPVTP